jgi:glycosyltransferase involved in cell wall biosynthesis
MDGAIAMTQPLITLVIPTYRRPQLLRRAIYSALRQTFRDLIVCVYDDASGDDTAAVVAEIAAQDPRVRYYCQPRNVGAAPNVNYGLRQVATPFFSMLSDDDVLLPELYEKAIAGFQRYPAAGCFCAKMVVYEPVHERLRHNQSTSWRSGYYDASTDNVLHELADHLPIASVVFKTQVIDTVGVFNKYASDLLYMAEVINSYPFIVDDFDGAIYTVHASGITVRRRQRGGGSDRDQDGSADRREICLFILNRLLNLEGKDVFDRFRLFTAVYNLTGNILSGDAAAALAAQRLSDFNADLDDLSLVRIPMFRRIALSSGKHLSRVFPTLAARFMALALNGWRTSMPAGDRQLLDYLESLERHTETVREPAVAHSHRDA